jgi:uncharacterized protein (DUF885 family)
MWDMGLSTNPKEHIGMLVNALLRDVRFVVSLQMHTEGMSLEKAEALFRKKAFQDPANARQQAARGAFDPGYLNYTVGKLMIRDLRDEWCASRGGRAAWREVHDAFLSYGLVPVPLIPEAMLGSGAGPAL